MSFLWRFPRMARAQQISQRVHLARRDVSEQHKKFSPMERIVGGPKTEKALQIATLERYASERSKGGPGIAIGGTTIPRFTRVLDEVSENRIRFSDSAQFILAQIAVLQIPKTALK